ncbi:hypothetical protein QQS21_010706 [Conoideocrella luteorostrata]|uniref:Uncharacterized protein n=1 Tax=Conoideocrella luteorostrata TaxID=1105319 RepID=A0AAJ0CEP1_9HYPO|nr:hypothetical protein QQS21_010706 [Conoideocrella luteorostrata]
MSSNPFRKKAPGTLDTARTGSPKSSLRSEDPVAASDRKSKPVKKVRVLSPPPLSPDSPEWKFDGSQPPARLSDDSFNFANYHLSFDPFNGASSASESDRDSTATPPPVMSSLPPQHQYQQSQDGVSANHIPANPFSKTLQDIEGFEELQKERKEEGEALKAANAGRKSLNVDSFGRLLMTGSVGDKATPVNTTDDDTLAMKSSSAVPAPQRSRNFQGGYHQSSTDSSDSDEEEEGEEEDGDTSNAVAPRQPNKDKKAPPPPPSSRHGKSLSQHIKLKEVLGDNDDVGHGLSIKSLSASQRRSAEEEKEEEDEEEDNDDEGESLSNRETGRVPAGEAEEEIEPQLNSALNRTNTSRKPAPAPPPPRGHTRSDSKVVDGDGPRRTSTEKAPTRSDSTRSSGHTPAPPPPRRPHTAPRQTSQISTPSVSPPGTAQATILTDQLDYNNSSSADALPHTLNKSSAPPPPPARHSSVRRPPSINNVEATSRRISAENRSREGLPPPPPPPPRHRSGSGNNVASLAKPPEGYIKAESGKSADILADLDALQREVDALRGKTN